MIKISNSIRRLMAVSAVAVLLGCPTSMGQENQKDPAGKPAKEKKKKAPQPFQWINAPGKWLPKVVRHQTFRSPSLGVDVGYCVMLPPGYSKHKSQRYPVVYYLHGGRPGSELKASKLAATIHKIMRDGASPVVYVFVNGGPVSHYNMPDDPKAQGADVFIKELIPHVDKTYRTIAHRNARGLEGFSQGGRGTMRLSLRHPDLFCSAAAGGGGYATEKRISEEGGYENPNLKFAEGDNTWDLARRYAQGDFPKVTWMIYVGTKGFNYENNLQYMKFLKSHGIPHTSLIVPDVPHSGSQIYEKEAARIMRFHAENFTRAQTIQTIDLPRVNKLPSGTQPKR